MKATKILLIMLMTMAVAVGCKQKARQETGSDTLSVEETLRIDPDSLETSDTIPNYYSEDLMRFGLHGRVKSVITGDYNSFVTCLNGPLNFNEEGKLTSTFSDLANNSYSMNNKGFIDETECRESDGSEFELDYEAFDDEGLPIRGEYKCDTADGSWVVKFTISYLKFDRENNWTKRMIRGEATTKNYDASGEVVSSQSEPYQIEESRRISYYR